MNVGSVYYVNRVALSGVMAPEGAACVPNKASCCFSRKVDRLGSVGRCRLIATLTPDRFGTIRSVHTGNVGIAIVPDRQAICFRGACNRGRSGHDRQMLTGTSPFAMRRLRGVGTRVFRLKDLLTSSFSLSIIGCLSAGNVLTMSTRKCLHRIQKRGICPVS